MNENAEKWVAALTSGEYAQTTGYLRTEEGFCCLGVACDLAVKAGVPVRVAKDHGQFSYDGIYGELPAVVRDWLGLASRLGSYGLSGRLTNDNDNGATFTEIAQTIRSHPELFVDGER